MCVSDASFLNERVGVNKAASVPMALGSRPADPSPFTSPLQSTDPIGLDHQFLGSQKIFCRSFAGLGDHPQH